jgi:hypothetical protein
VPSLEGLDPASGRGRGLAIEAVQGHRFAQSEEPMLGKALVGHDQGR